MREQLSRAEIFAAKRGLVCILLSMASLCFTLVTVMALGEGPLRAGQALLWAVWLAVPLVWVFGRPGGWRFSARERAVINDELVRANQQRASRWAMVLLAAGLAVQSAGALGYVAVPVWWPIAALGIGIAGAGLLFGLVELRSQ